MSSSGHLVIVKHFLGLDTGSGILLEVALHAGTLVSILVYYRLRIWGLCRGVLRGEGGAWRYGLCVFLGSLPAGFAYWVSGGWLESQFSRPLFACGMLCVTGLALLSLRWVPLGAAVVSPGKAVLVGVAQALAMLPGVSRSGATITAGRWFGFSPAEAAEFSFLLSIPALSGAILWEAVKLLGGGGLGGVGIFPLISGFLVSAAVGFCALSVLIRLLATRHFWLFGWYCLGAGAVAGALLAAGV